MTRLPDHPVIRNMERTGYPDGKEPNVPRCPCCGKECETIYKDRNKEVVGCDMCVVSVDSWEEGDCFPDEY